MVKKLVLFDKIYNVSSEKKRKDIFIRYFKYINEQVKGFHNTTINIKKLRSFDKRFEIAIYGPEDVFVYNLLKKEIGTITNFEDVRIGASYQGRLVDVGKVGFGIFVDCGILNPRADVLVTLRTLRNQLCSGKEVALKKIIKTYDLIDHFPLPIKVAKTDTIKNKLEGEIDKQFLFLINKIVEESLEGVFLSGETKTQFKKAIERSGHYRDIVSVERYGFLENIVLLKKGTDAPGIIAHIGKYLKNCKLSALRSKRIEEIFN